MDHQMKCPEVYCDFEGTQEEVDDHLRFVFRTGLEASAHGNLPMPGPLGYIPLGTFDRNLETVMKCPAMGGCEFEGTSAEIIDHLAKTHGHLVAEPCEECGNTISIGRNPETGRSWVCSDHTWACSLHPSNVPRPPGVHFVERGIGVDGKLTLKVDGVEQHPSCPYPHPEPKFAFTKGLQKLQGLSWDKLRKRVPPELPIPGMMGSFAPIILATHRARRKYWEIQGLTFDQATQAAYFELRGQPPRRHAIDDSVLSLPGGGIAPEDSLIRYPIKVRPGR
jgi:hypothetical protein